MTIYTYFLFFYIYSFSSNLIFYLVYFLHIDSSLLSICTRLVKIFQSYTVLEATQIFIRLFYFNIFDIFILSNIGKILIIYLYIFFIFPHLWFFHSDFTFYLIYFYFCMLILDFLTICTKLVKILQSLLYCLRDYKFLFDFLFQYIWYCFYVI